MDSILACLALMTSLSAGNDRTAPKPQYKSHQTPTMTNYSRPSVAPLVQPVIRASVREPRAAPPFPSAQRVRLGGAAGDLRKRTRDTSLAKEEFLS